MARRRSSSRPSVSRPPRYYRAKSVDRVGLSSVDPRPQRPSIPSTRPTMSSRTTPTRTRLVASILPGEDLRNCNLSTSPIWLFVCIWFRNRDFEESLKNQQYLWQFFVLLYLKRTKLPNFYKYKAKRFLDFVDRSLLCLIIVLSCSVIMMQYVPLLEKLRIRYKCSLLTISLVIFI